MGCVSVFYFLCYLFRRLSGSLSLTLVPPGQEFDANLPFLFLAVFQIFKYIYSYSCGPDWRSPYNDRLDSPEIESSWMWDFSHPSKPARYPSGLLCSGCPVSVPEDKAARAVALTTHLPSSAEFNPWNADLKPICHLLALLGGATIVVVSRLRVKEVFELCIYCPSGPLFPFLGWTFPFIRRVCKIAKIDY